MAHDNASHTEKPNLAEIERLVAETLTANGYRLSRKESQEWPVHFEVDTDRIDGTTELFFGPIIGQAGGGFELPFLLVRAETRRGDLHLTDGTSAAEAASKLISRVQEVLVDLLASAHRHDPNVGAGLLPVDGRPGVGPTRAN